MKEEEEESIKEEGEEEIIKKWEEEEISKEQEEEIIIEEEEEEIIMEEGEERAKTKINKGNKMIMKKLMIYIKDKLINLHGSISIKMMLDQLLKKLKLH